MSSLSLVWTFSLGHGERCFSHEYLSWMPRTLRCSWLLYVFRCLEVLIDKLGACVWKTTKVLVNVCLYVCKLDVDVHSLIDISHNRDSRLSSRAGNHCCHVLVPFWMTLTLFWRWEAAYGWDLPNCRGLHAYPFKLKICTTWLWKFQSLFLPAFSESHLETGLQYLSVDNSAHRKGKSTQRAIDRSTEIRMIQKSVCQQSTQNNSTESPSSTKMHAAYFRLDIFILF